MKTLDQVITSLDVCINSKGCKNCHYAVYDEDEFEEYTECKKQKVDALHYLKHLQEYYEMSETHDYSRLEPYNPPLTWDELRQMKGKPVWVEEPKFFGKRWDIISGINDEAVFGTSIGSMVFYTKDEQGKTWQAYRKERE